MRLRQAGCPSMGKSISGMVKETSSDCNKFWAHRADSYERLTRLSHYFHGLEADLVFDTVAKQFRVYHPPAPAGNLFADSYFQFIKSSGNHLWLDIKDIDSTEFIAATRFFIERESLYGLKKNVVIESSQIDFVNKLAKLGFTVSFMVQPTDLQNPNGAKLDSLNAKLFPEVKFVSQEDVFIDRLKIKFPEKKIITWAISFKNYFDLSHFRTLLKDTGVCVVLINIKSRNYK